MRVLSLLTLVLSLDLVTPTGGAAEKESEAEQIALLIKQLGDKSFSKRQQASKALEEMGEKSLPALHKASETSDDPEIRKRARESLRNIFLTLKKDKTTGREFVIIEAAEFMMGSPRNERNRRIDETEHKVRIVRPFLMAAHEVTQEDFEKRMKFNPSSFSLKGVDKDKIGGQDTDRFPVENVTWFDAIEYCIRLSKEAKYEPYYKLTDVKLTGDSITSATVTLNGGNGYRLPTEAEWEYACRAGTTKPFHFGFENTGREANTRPGPAIGYGSEPSWKALGRTAKVGSYKPNDWGLYDMCGNAAEWCWDWYEKDYDLDGPVNDKGGPAKGIHRTLRGGSWLLSEGSCRSASRGFMMPDDKKNYTGFRIARTP